MAWRLFATASVLLLVVSPAACTGLDKAKAKSQTAAEQLAAAKVKVDGATSMNLTLRSSGIPASVNGPLGADGVGTHVPAFKGTLNARISGSEAKVDVVAIDKLLKVGLPFTWLKSGRPAGQRPGWGLPWWPSLFDVPFLARLTVTASQTAPVFAARPVAARHPGRRPGRRPAVGST